VLVLLVARAFANEGACAEERERLSSVQRLLAPHEEMAAARATASLWAEVVRETCTWAGGRTGETDPCVTSHRCARLHAEDRLAWVAPGWDEAMFARATGHSACAPADGSTCAVAAADAAEERLRELVLSLRARGDSPDVAQVTWSRYREAACREDALAAGSDRAWTAAACNAVLTVRRADLLKQLAEDPAR
jgi:hypothetical protein